MILNIILTVLLLLGVACYMISRRIKILQKAILILTAFYFKVDIEMEKRRSNAIKIMDEAKELLNENGDIKKEEDTETFHKYIKEIYGLISEDLIIFAKGFYQHINKARSEVFWTWWDWECDLTKYIDKKYLDFLEK